jgi:hypothetical protein
MEDSHNQGPADTEKLTPDEADRLSQHGLHLDTMLFQRGNLSLSRNRCWSFLTPACWAWVRHLHPIGRR